MVMYAPNSTYNGDLKTTGGGATGREGADNLCKNATNKPAGFSNYRAFISVDANDEIRDMPANYGVPINTPIKGTTGGTTIANDWADLLDGTILTSLSSAGVASASYWRSGSLADGSIGTGTCSGWTSSSITESAEEGLPSATNGTWLDDGSPFACDNNTDDTILCLAY